MFDAYKELEYEQAIMELLGGLSYQTVYSPNIEHDFQSPLYDEVLEEQILKLNPTLPQEAIDNALYKLRNFDNGELVRKNEIEVKYSVGEEERATIVYVVDYGDIERNSFDSVQNSFI